MAPPSPHAPMRHPDALALERRITLDATHAAALRLREVNVKEAFTIVDREGHYFRATLTESTRTGGEARVFEAMPSSTESPAHITLFAAVLGRQRMLALLQKATELGVMRVVPVLTARSVQPDGLAHEKAHAWPAQAIRACRQCRRASVPIVSGAVSFESALADADFRAADLRVHLDDRVARPGEIPARPESISAARPFRVAFAVGPEGGFTDDERAAFDAAGVAPLRLGGRVLRAETAALVGLTILQHVYGDL